MTSKRIILFELNEVPPLVLDWYAERHPQSTVARLIRSGTRLETVAEDAGPLSPWITWPTAHRGVTNARHAIRDFGQELGEVDRAYPPVWRMLADAGVRVGVFGSLHSYPLPENVASYAFYVPDLFSPGSEAHPDSMEPLQSLMLRMSRASARNVERGVPMRDVMRLLRTLPTLGLKADTALRTAGQLANERINKARLVRRRTFQSVLCFDVFERQLARTRPEFATFFTNHVASSMHRYWVASFPHHYPRDLGFDAEWKRTFGGEIDFAMGEADRMLGRLVRFVDRNRDYRLVIASSMGQAAIENPPLRTQVYMTKPHRFFERLGIAATEWSAKPAMFPQYNFHVVEAHVPWVASALRALTINGEQVQFRTAEHGFFSVDFGQMNLPRIDARLGEEAVDAAALGLANVPIDDLASVTAYHVPTGSLLLYDGADAPQARVRSAMSTTELAPMILQNYHVKPPAYMPRAPALH